MAYLSNKLLLLLGWLAVMMVLLKERPFAHVYPREPSWYELSRRVLLANEDEAIDHLPVDRLQVYREMHPAPGLGKPVRAKGGETLPDSSSNRISLAIARPFANGRTEELVASFADWEAMPLSKDGCANHEIGLILTFPREGDPQGYADVYDAYEKIKEIGQRTNGWGGCIKSIDLFFAGLTVEEDFYSSYFAELGGVQNWVNGPNRQFERVFRFVQSQKKYDLWYLMEPDVFPQKNYWLDNLLEEITVAQPFAILGAKYLGFRTTRGEFRKVKNLLALHHINGNAVYNVTDPLLLNMISEFENEADTVFNAIPFDIRISQMMLEAGTGVAHPPALVSERKGYVRELPSKLDKLTGWYNEHASIYAPDDPVKESNVMSNMADYMLHEAVAERYSLIHDSSRKPGKFGRPINMKQ